MVCPRLPCVPDYQSDVGPFRHVIAIYSRRAAFRGSQTGRPREVLDSGSSMQTIRKLSFILSFLVVQLALAQSAPVTVLDQQGFIDVFELRKAVIRLEMLLPKIDEESCNTKACQVAANHQKRMFEKARSAFMSKWGGALLSAINKGDEVAEVIWRQCDTTPVIERSALASTCDEDPVRRKEAALRLRQIGFEAAFDETAEGASPPWERDQSKRRTQSQEHTIRQMEAGVYGNWTIDNHHGGNAPYSPEELVDIRRGAVIDAASTLARRAFTYVRIQNGYAYESHAKLRLNRRPLGTPTLAWSANVFHSGSPYTGPYDPARDGFKVYLQYDKHREIIVGGNRDATYLRMLHDTLMRSEQRIDDWLKRDPRWSVFLLHRQGHHEWVPEGMESPFGRLRSAWSGKWVLDKNFENFKPVANLAPAQLRIRVVHGQALAQFEEAGTSGYACELRYSGATSERPEDGRHGKTATSTALGYLPALSPISQFESGPVEPFAPMNPRKVYRQVLVQCPQGEWPDNRNKRFLFLAKNTLIEVREAAGSRNLAILHWRRQAPLNIKAQFNPLSSPFDRKQVLTRLEQEIMAAEQADAKLVQLSAKVDSLNVDELIASLTQVRLENWSFNFTAYPDNLVRLIATTGVSTEICAAYRDNPPDALRRFNFMVVLYQRVWNGLLTPGERAIVPDCLRFALNDLHPWTLCYAISALVPFAEEKDLAKLAALQKHSDEYVRRCSHDALDQIKSRTREH